MTFKGIELLKLRKGQWLSSYHMEVTKKAISMIFNSPELFQIVTDS